MPQPPSAEPGTGTLRLAHPATPLPPVGVVCVLADYVEFVGEYAPYDMYALENISRAVELFPHMSAMMKVAQEPRTFIAARSIGSGIQNLLFADPRTVEDVEVCVQWKNPD